MKTIILKRDSYRVYEEGKMVARFETEKEAQDFIGVQEEVAVSGVPYILFSISQTQSNI